jgi:RND family efflux transporter MFP subunit
VSSITRPRAVLRCAAILGLAALACLGACEGADDPNAYAPPPPPEVVVANPVTRDVTTYITYTGVVEASETVELRARVQGFLEAMHFEPGQRVEAGDLLFTIDRRQYEAEVAQAEATVRSLEAAYVGAVNDAALARELADQNAGPEIDAVIKAAARDSVAAEIERAQAALAEAQLNLDFCEVRTPTAGRVTRNLVDVGNLVGRGEPTLLATVVLASPAYVSVDISESDVLAVQRELEKSGQRANNEPGQISPDQWRPCELGLMDDDGFPVAGRVDYVEPRIDAATGTLTVRTRFENEDESLTPGFFARVRFPMSSASALLVPEAALLSDQQGRYAMVVNSENKVEVRRVEIGALDGDMRAVEEGLGPQDRVIVLGALKARPGAEVTPLTNDAAAPVRSGAADAR